MVDRNNLVCYEENNVKKWEMVKDQDRDVFLMNLLANKSVNKHTIFVIPECGILSGIWLWSESHKSSRVDFFHFHDDYGCVYEKPQPANTQVDTVAKDIEDSRGPSTKYGWISPDGRYFHCNFQEHAALADRICFGVIQTSNAEHYLEEHGWCKIYKPLLHDTYRIYTGGRGIVTKAQFETLKKLELSNISGLHDLYVLEE